MNPAQPSAPSDSNEEILALIETLHSTSQRLEELTAGEVDGVADREGRTYLLRHVQEQLRNTEAAKQAAILNALPANIALLDTQARIIVVNEAWRRFADSNGLRDANYGIGENYLDTCLRAQGEDATEAAQVAAGISRVLAGQEQHFTIEYPCHSPSQQRWFVMTVSPLVRGQQNGAVVMHIDITERRQAEEALHDSELELRTIFDSALDGILVTEIASGKFLAGNPAICQMLGYTREELVNIGIADIHPRPEASSAIAQTDRILHGDIPLSTDTRIRRKDASLFYADITRTAIPLGGKDCLLSMFRDITERKAAQDRIAQLNRVYAMLSGINTLIVRVRDRAELFREACRLAVDAGGFRMSLIAVVDSSGLIVPVASSGKSDALVTAITTILSSPEDAPKTLVARVIREKTTIVSNDSQNDPAVLFAKNYADSSIRSMAVLPLLVAGQAIGVLALYAGEPELFHEEEMRLLTELAGDIAFAVDHLDKQERLNYLAYFDVLTGLPNRTLFYERLTQGLALARRNQTLLAVLSVDLDNFKTVIDTLGHGGGDLCLQEVGRRLAACLRDTDTVGRMSSDKFAIILPEIENSEAAANVARKVIASGRKAYQIDGHELFVSASIGIALFPDDADNSDGLVSNADSAMYRAKDLGRNTYQFFTAEMNRNTQDKLRLEADLHYALPRGEFLLYYQPQVSCTTGKVTGLEALLRWQHPQRGLVGPSDFIPALETTDLIIDVSAWVLTTACIQAQNWHAAGLGTPTIAVNVSGRQMLGDSLYQMVRAALDTSGLAPAYLELELTESQLMKNAENVIGILTRLKAMGVKLSVDDFGTGYSSLAYLKRFPIDSLKVDRAFVRDIIADPNDVSITRAIITLAHSLNLKVVAEGVETEGQLGLLIANYCDEIQGYYFSWPLPAEEATALLRTGRSLDSRMLGGMKRSRTLLLVDDEVNILASLKRLLRADGYQILTASGAEQGLELLARHRVDVIVSDQRMPGMSGVEFLRRVKVLHPATIRLVLSGYTDLQTVTDAINEGAIYKFLTKPWDDSHLRANIQEAFRAKEMADENRRLHSEVLQANSQITEASQQLQKLPASPLPSGDTPAE
ncbi:EAL domain-containing protein [Dechloromonas sp. A34]|uniref:EAL domain-containing protein n=1 Tax=Dechloromonas sp. A34 TaxID=447588 RepID=UPI002249A19D|nr:EAL domain-containing protein [Dechloromonas sp. A34]